MARKLVAIRYQTHITNGRSHTSFLPAVRRAHTHCFSPAPQYTVQKNFRLAPSLALLGEDVYLFGVDPLRLTRIDHARKVIDREIFY